MLRNFKRIMAALLSVLMLVGMFASIAVTVSAADEASGVKKGEFVFAPHTYTDGDLSDIYYYTDEVFSGSAFDYNEHLATMSMILASASISSQDADAGYDVKSRNLSYLLREWDFAGFDVNEYYTQKPGEQTMGVGMAYKVIGEGENAYTLLAIVPRSAGYQKEWAGNFTVGTEGVHEGFATGRDIILEFAKKYVEENADKFEGTVKVWTVGYSRGAGVSNLLAAYLDDNNNALGVEVKKENIFAYTPSNQILRHEVGHDMVAKGEVDIAKVRQKIKDTFKTDKEVDQIAEYYATAYAMSTSTAEDVEAIWEEVICDSLADMNVFSGSKMWAEAAEHMGMTIPAVQKAISEGKANQTRGAPDIKKSQNNPPRFSVEFDPVSGEKFVVIEPSSIANLMLLLTHSLRSLTEMLRRRRARHTV